MVKEASDFLRHPLMGELVSPEPSINEEAVQLMKFHGSYMQVRPLSRAGEPNGCSTDEVPRQLHAGVGPFTC